MTLTKWQRPNFGTVSPFRRMTSLRDEVDNLFDLAFGRLTDRNLEMSGNRN